MTRLRGDDGALDGIGILALGIVAFIVGALFLANLWAIVDAKTIVTSAAREATRAAVEAPPEAGPSEVNELARSAGIGVIAGHGRAEARADIEALGPLSLARCAVITYEARYQLDLVSVPGLGGFGGSFTVSARHSEIVDPLRDGLIGEATCVS